MFQQWLRALRRSKFKSLPVVLAFTACGAIQAAQYQYDISISKEIETADVQICFDGKPPSYLSVEDHRANKDLIQLPESSHGTIKLQGKYWKVGQLAENACLNYQIDISGYHAKRSKHSKNRKNIAYMADNNWLWLPNELNTDDDVIITFHMPEGANVSTPWIQTDFSKFQYQLVKQPQNWGYSLLLGDFDLDHEKVGLDQFINITTPRNMPKASAIKHWLGDIGRSLTNYLGRYPVKQSQIIVISKPDSKSGPVPWGDFSRGSGFGIRFVINPDYPIEDFYADWTATHEFSHQLLPFIKYDDIWLSEGLASYLQYVLMAQAGTISHKEAWARLYKGFKRGEKGTKKVSKEPLSMASFRRSRGGRTGRTMRIYWSGALYFMQADIELRQASGGKTGLNDILLKLNECCILGSYEWTGERLAEKLDHLSNTKIFSKKFSKFSNSYTFPKYVDTFKAIGINRDGEIISKKNSRLAKEIMTPARHQTTHSHEPHHL